MDSNYEKLYVEKTNFFLLIVVLIFQTVDNAFRDNNVAIFGNIKLVILLFTFVIFSIELFVGHRKILFLKYESKVVITWYLLLLIISIYWMYKNNTWNTSPFILGILRILTPVFFAYLVVNLISPDEVYKAMYFFLIISFIVFVCNEVIMGRFSFREIFSLSLTNSSGSEMESNFFSPTAFSLCCYFGYFRKNKIPLIISVIFTILTYKRLMALFAIFLLFFGGMLKNKKVFLWVKILTAFLFFGMTVWYIKLNLGRIDDNFIYNIFNQSLDKLTMGRTWLFQNIYVQGFPRSGLFSVLNSIYRSPEMDLPVMFLEMGYFAIIVTIIALLSLIKRKLFGFVIIIFVLLEMLTSHFFDITFFWVVLYILIGYVNNEKNLQAFGNFY